MLLLLLLLTLAACATPPSLAPAPAAHETEASPRVIELTAGRSVEGREIPCRVLGEGPETTLVLATIHGNEPAGTPLVRQLERVLLEHPELLDGQRVVLVPVANPDGFATGRRFNVRGVDLNRNFPSDNFRASKRNGKGSLSEPESRALHGLILQFQPRRVISIHQPVACIDWDGPADHLARALAAAADLPARRIGSRPGSLGSWVGLTLSVPIITIELPRGVHRLPDATLWRRYGRMMVTAVTWPASAPEGVVPLLASTTVPDAPRSSP